MFAVAQQRNTIDRADSGLPVRSPQTVPGAPGSAAYVWPMNSATKEQSAQIGPTRRTRGSGARTNRVNDFGCRGVCGFASARRDDRLRWRWPSPRLRQNAWRGGFRRSRTAPSSGSPPNSSGLCFDATPAFVEVKAMSEIPAMSRPKRTIMPMVGPLNFMIRLCHHRGRHRWCAGSGPDTFERSPADSPSRHRRSGDRIGHRSFDRCAHPVAEAAVHGWALSPRRGVRFSASALRAPRRRRHPWAPPESNPLSAVSAE
jgi:hypothetical protein